MIELDDVPVVLALICAGNAPHGRLATEIDLEGFWVAPSPIDRSTGKPVAHGRVSLDHILSANLIVEEDIDTHVGDRDLFGALGFDRDLEKKMGGSFVAAIFPADI